MQRSNSICGPGLFCHLMLMLTESDIGYWFWIWVLNHLNFSHESSSIATSLMSWALFNMEAYSRCRSGNGLGKDDSAPGLFGTCQ